MFKLNWHVSGRDKITNQIIYRKFSTSLEEEHIWANLADFSPCRQLVDETQQFRQKKSKNDPLVVKPALELS